MVVTLDTTRRDAMGFHGRSPSITPCLDALAAESVVFEDAYTVTPLTLPAHASLLTGLHPVSHRLRDNSIAALPPEATTLAEVLRASGRRTGAAVSAFVLDSSWGLDQGFESYDDVPRDPTGSKLFIAERRGDRTIDRALADLAAMDGPFFYWVHLFDPHFPYQPPGVQPRPVATMAEIRAEKRRCYDEEIRFADRQVGRLLDALRARPDWEEIAVVVTADHGESLADGVEETHGWFLYDATVRVPLILRAPGLAARRSPVQASLVDVMPTLLELLGLERPDLRFDGVSLAAAARGGDERPERTIALESWYAYANFGWSPLEGCVDGPLKYLRSRRERLFDRAADPAERTDLFAPQEPRAVALRRRLDALIAEPAALLEPAGIELDDDARRRIAELGYVAAATLDLSTRPDFTALEEAEDHLEVVRGLDDVHQAFLDGRIEDSVRLLRRMCEAAPGAASMHEELAAMLLTLNRPELLEEAEEHLKIAISLAPDRGRSHFDLGLVCMRRMGIAFSRRDLAQAARWRRDAIAEFRLALDADRDSPKALANLATLLRLEADSLPPSDPSRPALLDEAIASLERFLAVLPPTHPDHPPMSSALAEYRTHRAKLSSPSR